MVVAAAEPLPGDPVMGLRSLDDGYVPPILDVSKLDRKLLVSNAESVAAVHALLDREGHLRGRLGRRGRPRRAADRRGAAGGLGRRLRARRRRLEVPLGRLLARRDVEESMETHALVVVPDAIRAELARTRRGGGAERVLRRDRLPATASPSATSAAATASPRRTATSSRSTRRCGSWRTRRLTSSPSSTRTRRPSRARRRTDRELSGLWAGKTFLIYGLKLDELRAWRITPDEVEELPLA